MPVTLHVLLGEGGVGKTTLAAAYALALARAHRRVGLLGIDPSGRLRDALGLAELPEQPVEVAGVHSALLRPREMLLRWAEGELVTNPFFVALADRLAGATDALAAIRMAEWVQEDPLLDDLVVDTAPGLNGIEFLARPEKLLSFMRGRLLRWLARAPERPARRLLRGLTRIAGGFVLLQLGDFSLLVQRVAARMIARLEEARVLLRDAELLAVCVARPGAAAALQHLTRQLKPLRLAPSFVVLNRALPPGATVPDLPEAQAFRRFVQGSLQHQETLLAELKLPVVQVPIAAGLDGEARLDALAQLGGFLARRTAIRAQSA